MTEGIIPPTTPVAISWPTTYPVALLPCGEANVTASPSVKTVSMILLKPNQARRGLLLFNTSAAQPVYVVYGAVADMKASVGFAIKALDSWQMPYPIYQGALAAVRLAGDGVVVCTELT